MLYFSSLHLTVLLYKLRVTKKSSIITLRSFNYYSLLSDYDLLGPVKIDTRANHIYKLYLTLPYVPAEDMASAVLHIGRLIRQIPTDSTRTAFRRFHSQYIIAFWMLRIRPERFSTYGLHHRTNNPCESIHASMKRLIPVHGRIFKFVENLHKHVFLPQLALVQQIESGLNPIRPKRTKQQKVEQTVAKLEAKYLSRDPDFRLPDYMDSLCHLFPGFHIEDRAAGDPEYEDYLANVHRQDDEIFQQANAGLPPITEDFSLDENETLVKESRDERDRLGELVKVCPICHQPEPEDQHGLTLPCAHHGCLPCLTEWHLQKGTCSTCRTNVTNVIKLPDENVRRRRELEEEQADLENEMLLREQRAAANAAAAARPDDDGAGGSGLQPPVLRRKRGRPRGPSRGRVLTLSRRQRLADSQRATPPVRDELPDLSDADEDDDDDDDEVVFNFNASQNRNT